MSPLVEKMDYRETVRRISSVIVHLLMLTLHISNRNQLGNGRERENRVILFIGKAVHSELSAELRMRF